MSRGPGRGCWGVPGAPSPPLTLSPTSCKQNQDMLSFYAIVIGLNNAAVSRLRLTWEVRAGGPLTPTVLPGLPVPF